MSLSAAAIRLLANKGMSAQDIAEIAAAIELQPSPATAPRAAHDPAAPVWVYVIGVDHPDSDLVKVGISKHPNYRRLTLQNERGVDLYLAHTEGPFTRVAAAAVERNAHSHLAPEREKGEWFLCGVERAKSVVRACAVGAGK